jgi:hypothetical protein
MVSGFYLATRRRMNPDYTQHGRGLRRVFVFISRILPTPFDEGHKGVNAKAPDNQINCDG